MPPALPTVSTISPRGLERLGLALVQHAVDDLHAVGLHGDPAALARLVSVEHQALAVGGHGAAATAVGRRIDAVRRERRGVGAERRRRPSAAGALRRAP